jgi:hypothetical protein
MSPRRLCNHGQVSPTALPNDINSARGLYRLQETGRSQIRKLWTILQCSTVAVAKTEWYSPEELLSHYHIQPRWGERDDMRGEIFQLHYLFCDYDHLDFATLLAKILNHYPSPNPAPQPKECSTNPTPRRHKSRYLSVLVLHREWEGNSSHNPSR